MKFSLILLVTTTTVERDFSTMKFIKNRLSNQMVDQWMNDCLVTYIKTDVFDSIDNEVIMKRFQNIKTLLCTFLKICLYLTFVEGIVLIF